MLIKPNNRFLRAVLLVDAATCIAAAAVMAAGATVVNGLTDIPTAVLLPAGSSLLPIAAFIAFVATRTRLSTGLVWLVILGNVGWVVGSLYLMLGGAISPNLLGRLFIGAQALAVAVLSWLEYRGVTRLPAGA